MPHGIVFALKMASKVETNNKVSLEKVCLETDQGIVESEERKWGLPLKDVYKHGLAFFKGNFFHNFCHFIFIFTALTIQCWKYSETIFKIY